jgi:hypothetical protein
MNCIGARFLVIAVLGLGIVACGPGTSDSSGGAGGVYSCAYETRQVVYCGGTMPQGDWAAYCHDGACPSMLDEHASQYPNASGGECGERSEYRNVVDFQGTCADWTIAGQPLVPPMQTYCGHSLLYNEFDVGTGIESTLACANCLQASCASEYMACDPRGDDPCDKLIRCLRKCSAGDQAADDACTQQYGAGVTAANALQACAVTSCPGICN